MENLSSGLTFFYKFVFPVVWFVPFASVTALMFIAPDALESDVTAVRWFFLAATCLGGGFMYWFCVRIKRVALADRELVISNYIKTIRTPLGNVQRVSSSILMNPEQISIDFIRPTDFGFRIVFLPKQRFFGGYTRHPLAKRLSDLLADLDSGERKILHLSDDSPTV